MKKQNVILYILIAFILISAIVADANADELIYNTAIKHGIDPVLFKAILTQESRLKVNAVNSKSLDYGIGQINIRTIASYNFDKNLLLSDKQYSLESSAIVLKDFKKAFKHKEPLTWYCRYNIGYGKLEGRKKINCINYIKKVLEHI